jgi:hypothetical protein
MTVLATASDKLPDRRSLVRNLNEVVLYVIQLWFLAEYHITLSMLHLFSLTALTLNLPEASTGKMHKK